MSDQHLSEAARQSRLPFVKSVIPWLVVPIIFWLPVPLFQERVNLVNAPSGWLTSAISDTMEAGGGSRARMIAPATVEIVLNTGVRHPWAGMSLTPPVSGVVCNAAAYDLLEITASGRGADAAIVSLQTLPTQPPTGARIFPLQPSECSIVLADSASILRIPITRFQTAAWWLRETGLEPDHPSPPDLSHLVAIHLRNSHERVDGVPQVLTITHLALVRTPRRAALVAFIATAIWLVGCGIVFLIRLRRPRTMPLVYRKLDVRNVIDEEAERLIAYIRNRHNDPDLTLEGIAAGSGIHSKKIPAILKTAGFDSFKRCLNSIRMEHAQKLLRESDRSVSEIALDVGYSTVTHFNRIFKDLTGCSPSEFRKTPPPA